MSIVPIKESPSLRDIFAAQIAGELVSKSDIKITSDDFYLRKMTHHNEALMGAIAFVSYQLADKLLAERVRKD